MAVTEMKVMQRDPNVLNSVGIIMTPSEFKDIPGDPSRCAWVPVMIPDVTEDRERIARQGITVDRVNLGSLSDGEQNRTLLETADLYGRIFAATPWNEEPLPVAEQAAELAAALARPDAQFLLVRNRQDEIKGFSMAWTTTPEEFATEKWETPEMQQTVLRVLQRMDIKPDEPMTYFAEAGIDPELRGKGISRIFYADRLDVARKLRNPVVVRTIAPFDRPTPINVLAQEFGMKQILGPVVGIGGRRGRKPIIRVSQTTAFGGIDTEKPDRVLYALAGIR